MADLPVPPNARDVGECIYCGTTGIDLTREHAIPYGLNGPWTLLRASCAKCAEVTHRFERDTLRGLHGHIRAILGMQTRRQSDRPRILPLVLEFQGEQRTLMVPTGEYPAYLPTPIFPPPTYVTGESSLNINPDLQFLHVAGPSMQDAGERHGAGFAGSRLSFVPTEFARTLAKVAFTAAVFALGLEPFRTTPIRRVILGDDRDVWRWVGSWLGDPINDTRGLHAMKVLFSGSDIHVVLRLFAQFGAPEYHVVLGPAAPEFVTSSAWPWR